MLKWYMKHCWWCWLYHDTPNLMIPSTVLRFKCVLLMMLHFSKWDCIYIYTYIYSTNIWVQCVFVDTYKSIFQQPIKSEGPGKRTEPICIYIISYIYIYNILYIIYTIYMYTIYIYTYVYYIYIIIYIYML